MPNILNLPAWEILEVQQVDDGQAVKCEFTRHPYTCPHCGVVAPRVTVHQYHDQIFNDVPHHGMRTALVVHRRRYKCLECSKDGRVRVFLQELDDMDETHKATKRLVSWIAEESLRESFAHVARQSGFDERTVRRIFDEHVEHLERTVKFVTPEWLGIDEVHLLKSARAVFGNLKEFTVIEMLPTTTRRAIYGALVALPDRQRVEVVTIDMTRRYLEAANAALPQAVVIVDKFHMVRMASDAMETVRRALRAELNSRQRAKLIGDRYKLLKRRRDLDASAKMIIQAWFSVYPELGEAYRLKEAFYDLYDESADPAEAKDRLDAWKADVKASSVTAPYRKLLTAVGNWEHQILEYFRFRATNAAVEAMNGGIKRMHSEGRGYSFRALRAKVLYGKPHKTRKTSIRTNFVPSDMMGLLTSSEHTETFGVPFDSLGDEDEKKAE